MTRNIHSNFQGATRVEPLEPRRLLSGTVKVHVYLDNNSNGEFDSGEQVSGPNIYFDLNNNGIAEQGEPNQGATINGTDFNLANGTYTVRINTNAMLPVFDPVDRLHTVVVADNQQQIYFGLTNQTGVANGFVYNDANGDAYKDGNELGIEGIRVYSDSNNNQQFDPGEVYEITSQTGEYTMYHVPGQARIRVEAGSNWNVTSPAGGGVDVTFAVSELETIDFAMALRGTSEISGRVYKDVNGNGIINFPEDEFMANWTLYLDANNNQSRDLNEVTTTTDSQGMYAFTELAAGTHRIRVDLQPGYTAASPAGGTLTLTIPDNHSTDNNDLTVQETPATAYVKNDFNGDGKADLLFRNAATGVNTVWYMNGAQRLGTANLTSFAGSTWNIGATGDFNGDGKTDIVFHDTATGEHILWYMNGITRISGVDIQQVNPVWRMVGAGDFDQDGNTDLVFRHTQTGAATVWYMEGDVLNAFGALPKVATQNWQIAGVEDFDGDGDPDLLWTNSTTKQNSLWMMNNRTVINDGFRGMPYPNAAGWRLARVADFDDDGTADLLWANDTTGGNSLWLLGNVNNKPVPFTFSRLQVSVAIPA